MEKKLTNSGPLREPADKHSIYTLLLGEQGFQTLLAPGFLLLQVFDDVAVRAGRLGGRAVTQQLVIGGDLLP